MSHRVVLAAAATLSVCLVLSVSGEDPRSPPATAPAPQAKAPASEVTSPPPGVKAPAGPYWPQFNGPRGDNRSPDTGLLRSWPADGPRLLWNYESCGYGYSSVAIADGMIFTAGDFEDEVKVIALDMSGKLLWTAKNGKAWKTPWPGTRSTPTWNDGLVYHLGAFGRLAAYEARTGKPVWNVMLECEGLSQGGYAESVVIDGNNLICMPGSEKEFIVALDKKTGKKVWVSNFAKTDWDRASYVSPLLVDYNGRRHIIHMSLFWLMCLDAKTGKVEWQVRHKIGPEHCEVVAVSPVWCDGRVFMTKGYEMGSKMFAIGPSGTSVTKLWEHRASDSEHAAAIAHNGCIFVPGNYVYPLGGWREKEAKEGSLYCLDMATGKERWVAKTGRCTLTYADGRIYALNEFGKVFLIEATPEKFNVVGELQIPRNTQVWALTLTHPVVVGGRMYVRDHDQLHVYDVKGRGTP